MIDLGHDVGRVIADVALGAVVLIVVLIGAADVLGRSAVGEGSSNVPGWRHIEDTVSKGTKADRRVAGLSLVCECDAKERDIIQDWRGDGGDH